VTRDDFEDSDQLRIGNDGIFMLTFFSKSSAVFILLAWSSSLTSASARRTKAHVAMRRPGQDTPPFLLVVKACAPPSAEPTRLCGGLRQLNADLSSGERAQSL